MAKNTLFPNLTKMGFFKKPKLKKTKQGLLVSRQGKSLLKLIPSQKMFKPIKTKNPLFKRLFTRTVKDTSKFYIFDFKVKKSKQIERLKIRKTKR